MSKKRFNPDKPISNSFAIGPTDTTSRLMYSYYDSLDMIKSDLRQSWAGQPRQKITVKIWQGENDPVIFTLLVGNSRYGSHL